MGGSLARWKREVRFTASIGARSASGLCQLKQQAKRRGWGDMAQKIWYSIDVWNVIMSSYQQDGKNLMLLSKYNPVCGSGCGGSVHVVT
jgi:hypothetical protein